MPPARYTSSHMDVGLGGSHLAKTRHAPRQPIDVLHREGHVGLLGPHGENLSVHHFEKRELLVRNSEFIRPTKPNFR